ncbi:MAG: hypothetical protein QM765_11095 [Myxococcales bacterium]
MPLISLHFTFTQRFRLPAREVYAWATDFSQDDPDVMGLSGSRRVEHLAPDTVLLTDRFGPQGKRVTKKKLVRLYPERMSWTNTHLAGPNRHSQFLYELVSDGPRACHLVFTGSQVNYPAKAPSAKELKAMVDQVREDDAALWKRLAAALQG